MMRFCIKRLPSSSKLSYSGIHVATPIHTQCNGLATCMVWLCMAAIVGACFGCLGTKEITCKYAAF